MLDQRVGLAASLAVGRLFHLLCLTLISKMEVMMITEIAIAGWL